MKCAFFLCALLVAMLGVNAVAQGDRQQFIRADAKTIALTHVRIVDGTGAAPVDEQTIVVSDGKIASVGPSSSAAIPPAAQVLDLAGYTVLPGLVGMQIGRAHV